MTALRSGCPAAARPPRQRGVFGGLALLLSTLIVSALPCIALADQAGAAAAAATGMDARAKPDKPVGGATQVVYHLSEGVDQASRALLNIRNHLAAEPDAHIVVVGLGAGIDFMLDGAHDAHGNSFESVIDSLTLQGVDFRACNNTLQARGIDRSRVLSGVRIVPSGVAEISRLQFHDGYAYFRP